MISIDVARVSHKDRAMRFIDAVHGKTYMHFEVLCCPSGGEFQIVVQTDYTDDVQEAQDMLNALLFSALSVT